VAGHVQCMRCEIHTKFGWKPEGKRQLQSTWEGS